MSLAGFINANFAVVPDIYVGQEIGVNVYPSKIRGAGFVIVADRISQYVNYDHPWSYHGTGPAANAIFLAKPDT